MMLRAASILAFTMVSATSFGFTEEHCGKKFTGGGEWKGADGSKGKWSEVLEFHKGDRGMSVSQTVTTEQNGQTDTHKGEWIAVGSGNGFFDVMKDGGKLGSGYCFGHVCHYGYETGAGRIEETYYFGKKGVHKIGSMDSKSTTGATDQVAWMGGMKGEDMQCERQD